MLRGGIRRLVVASLAFVAFAPVGMATVPLAGLLLLARPATRGERIALITALGVSLWWLAQPGTVADQVARTVALLGGATFALLTRYSRDSVIHRGLIAAATAAAGVALGLLALGWSWEGVRWWVERRTSFQMRLALAKIWPPSEGPSAATTALTGVPNEVGRWLESGVRVMADQYAAIVVLQLLAGLALAAALYHRVRREPVGLPPGRFRDFRFSEHLGWAAVAALAVVLIPRLAAAKLAAANVLVITGALYALRGAAVTTFGLGLVGGPGTGTMVLLGLSVVLILPAVIGGAIVLGVVDAGLDLRRRWAAAAANR